MKREEARLEAEDDPLGRMSTSPNALHLKTYTAGEDRSRLAAVARELGLQQARDPRPQVRKRTPFLLRNDWATIVWNTATEDARIRSVYTWNERVEDDDSFFISKEWNDEEELVATAEPAELEAHGGGGGTLSAAVLGIIKAMVGPAILYLPHGFAKAGYLVAIPLLILCTSMYLYSASCLLDAWKLQKELTTDPGLPNDESTLLRKRRKRHLPLSYPELAYRALGMRGETLVKFGIGFMQSGVCLSYFIFAPQNLHTSVQTLTGINISPSIWLILVVLIQVPLSWLRDIRKLTPTNLIANTLILYGLTICLLFAFYEATTPAESKGIPSHSRWSELRSHFDNLAPYTDAWYLFIGTSVFLFEGSITLLVPLQEAVHTEKQQAAFPTVYRRVILCIICFYTFFGITSWMAFGEKVRTVLTTSLPANAWSTSVQLAYSVAVIFTFPLQNFPALEISTRSISQAFVKNSKTKPFYVKRNFISTVMVCALAGIAVMAMDSLDKVVSLMGSLLGCPIAFVVPPLIHSRLDANISPQRKFVNQIVAGLGILAMILASLATVITW